jgi:hypothetical protein
MGIRSATHQLAKISCIVKTSASIGEIVSGPEWQIRQSADETVIGG